MTTTMHNRDQRKSHAKLDPEIKAMKTVLRAMEPLGNEQRRRVLVWAVAYQAGLPNCVLPEFTRAQ